MNWRVRRVRYAEEVGAGAPVAEVLAGKARRRRRRNRLVRGSIVAPLQFVLFCLYEGSVG